MHCDVSVIIPVHNVPPQLLQKCSESLSCQTLRTMEVLWVMDGPDVDARGIIETYVRRDRRMRILQCQVNHGVSAARNVGLDNVRGQWFAFVDADDEVLPDLFTILLDAARQGHVSLASCDWHKASPSEVPLAVLNDRGATEAIRLDFSRSIDLARAVLLTHNGACWARLFERERFGNLRFDEDLRFGEDWVFLQKALALAEGITWVPRSLYIYNVRGDSASHADSSVAAYHNWLTALKRRTVLARSFLADNELAARLVAWDAWQGSNNLLIRSKWSSHELYDAWVCTKHFFESVACEIAKLPWDVRAAVRWEMLSIKAFKQRPQWLARWLRKRSFTVLAQIDSSTSSAGESYKVERTGTE